MEYKTIPILDAAALCGIAFDRNRPKIEVKACCPFCGDKKNHLSLNTVKNMFRCNRCNETGNSVSLYAKYFNIDNATAYRELTSAGNTFREPGFGKKELPRIRQYKAKPLSDRHDVYYDMLQKLELSPEHRQDLLHRGLDNATIDANMYRTMPVKHTKQYAGMMYSLSERYDLSGIPGFYQQNGSWQMYTVKGLFIPVCNYQGYIQGLQIRRDGVSEDKYRCFSSSFFNNGTEASSCIHVANWNGEKTVYVTEGALKAEVASFLMGNASFIGVAGVNSINGLAELLDYLGVHEVIEAFDMDKLTNACVAGALRTLKRQITEKGIKFRSAKWNPAFNGIDEYYLAMRERQAIAA